jgi:hypothetical protein
MKRWIVWAMMTGPLLLAAAFTFCRIPGQQFGERLCSLAHPARRRASRARPNTIVECPGEM